MRETMKTPGGQKGMTLIEIMVAVVIGMIVMAAVYTGFLAQNAAYVAQSKITESQENGRIALDFIASEVRMAGFGITPSIAFNDFQNPPTGCSGTACGCRDNVAADGGADEIYFAYRDPYYQWGPISIANQVFGYPNLSNATQFSAGTIFWVIDATYDPTLVNTVFFQAGCSNCNPVTQDTSGTRFYNPIANLNLQGINPQFNNGYAYKILYRHFYIDTTSGTPILMFDEDPTGNKTGAKPVASGIEDVQFAYIMANGDELLGPAFPTTCPTPAPTPATPAQYGDTHNAVNIRAVRISVVARSATPDQGWQGSPLNVENHSPGGTDGYRRRLFQSTVNTWNMVNAGGYFSSATE